MAMVLCRCRRQAFFMFRQTWGALVMIWYLPYAQPFHESQTSAGCFLQDAFARVYENIIAYSTSYTYCIYPSVQPSNVCVCVCKLLICNLLTLSRNYWGCFFSFWEIYNRTLWAFWVCCIVAAAWRKWLEACGACPMALINIYLIVCSVSSYTIWLYCFC